MYTANIPDDGNGKGDVEGFRLGFAFGKGDVMKLKNTFTPPTTGLPQLAEVVLVAAALQ